MRSKLQNITSRLLAIFMVVGLCVANSSCTDPETTDSTKFAIFYAGVTDIGPSMNFNMSGPTYIGGTPSDFAITRVTLNGEVYETNSFQISDPNTGAIKLVDTDNLPVGTYCLSISCISNGKYYEFKDAITVNMLAPVPEGITVDPSEVTVDFADIYKESASAQVKTEEGTHVHISKYEIIQEEGKEYFTISNTGKITVNDKYEGEILPGKYVLNLKLTTEAGAGIYENAVTFNITSSPLALTYQPASVKVEKDQAYTSSTPIFKGSTDGLTYKIKSVSPETSAISIDEQTGVITLSANNGLEIGNSYSVVVTATNQYGSKDFTETPFVINIVAFINPITKLQYANQEKIQSVAFEFTPEEVDGDELTYSFVDLDPKLTDKLNIDRVTGAISARKGNSIETGTYTITVKAENGKSDKTATFTLTINPNPNYFTYIRYGNNLGLTPEEKYADQFEYDKKATLLAATLTPKTDIPAGRPVKWTVKIQNTTAMGGTTISETGELSFSGNSWNSNYGVSVVFVTATVGEGEEAISKTIPVFIRQNKNKNEVFVKYTPFAVKMNPSKGGTVDAPEVTLSGVLVTDYTKFLMDYRRDFYYYSFIENHVDGIQSVAGSFMNSLWKVYWDALGKTNNTAARAPMSYYDNTNLSLPLGYVDNKDFSVVINPGKWKDSEGVYANGVFIGRMSFVTDGNQADLANDGTTKNQIFPLAIWFDESF